MATTSARTHGHQQPHPYGLRHDPLRRMRGLDAKSALRASPRTATMAAAALLVPLGAALLGASGLALAATLTGLAVVTPLLVIFSPVLIPFVLAAVLLASGLLASGALSVAGISALTWAVGYVWRWHGEGGGGVTGMVVQPLDQGLKCHGVEREGTAAAFVGHRRPLPRDIDVASA